LLFHYAILSFIFAAADAAFAAVIFFSPIFYFRRLMPLRRFDIFRHFFAVAFVDYCQLFLLLCALRAAARAEAR